MDARTDLARRWLGELPIYAIALALFATCAALLTAKGIPLDAEPILVNARLYLLTVLAWLAIDAARFLHRTRPDSPSAALRERYTTLALKRRIAAGLPLLALCVVLMPFFSMMKAAIPLFNAYTWDTTFIAWDRALFFGHDGWRVLQPIIGYPPVTAFLALLYQVWFLLLYPGVMAFAFLPIDSTVRRRFFLTYVLAWTLIGGLSATLLASVGPVFVGPLLGDHTFDAQIAYLHAADAQIPVMTLTVQKMLLDWFHADANGLGSGITAMPSMHIAMVTLFWLASRAISRRAGRWFLAFGVAIFVGSIHLGYHYGVDGVVSLAMVICLWALSRPLFALWDRLTAQAALRTNTVPAE